MKRYYLVFRKAFKSKLIYRSAFFSEIITSLLSFVIQIFLWSALLQNGVKHNTDLNDMILFVLINSFVLTLTNMNISGLIEASMIDGSIAMELIRPITYKYYLLSQMLGSNACKLLSSVVPLMVGSVFILEKIPIVSWEQLVLFFLSLFLGVLLIFEINYLFGLLAFWIQRCWFLGWYMNAFTVFFGGTTVPLWFYPDILKTVSYYLPFRYITFEPINIILGKTSVQNAWSPLCYALIWLIVLNLLDKVMWSSAVRRLSVNGG